MTRGWPSLGIAAALIAACAPPPVFHRAGADPDHVEATRTGCEIAALRAVPRDIRTRHVPASYHPVRRCTRHGHCHIDYLLTAPARTESYDANAALRARATDQCMVQAGFRPVRLPACDPSEVRLPPRDAAQPALDGTSCVLRRPTGEWQVVTPQ